MTIELRAVKIRCACKRTVFSFPFFVRLGVDNKNLSNNPLQSRVRLVKYQL
jgi:hypothetical protein